MKKTFIISLIVAILGIIVPIVYDWYSSYNELQFRLLSVISLMDDDPILDEMSITYKDTKINNLTKIQMAMVNSGRTPISSEDVKVFPTIHFSGDTQLLVTKIVRKDPLNIRADFSNESSKEVSLQFELLNPSDFVEFNLYIVGNYDETPFIDSRIKGVKDIKLVDKTDDKFKFTDKFKASVYVVGFFTLIFLSLAIYGFKIRKDHQHVRELLRRNPDMFIQMKSIEEIDDFIKTNLRFLNSDEVIELYSILVTSLKRFGNKKVQFSELASEYINSVGGGEGIIVISLFTVPIGVIYIISQIM